MLCDACARFANLTGSCFTESAQPNQNQLDMSASENFRFGGGRAVESQLASSSALRSQQRQHSSLSIFQAHSSTSEQKQTVSKMAESSAADQGPAGQLHAYKAKQASVSNMAAKQQASAATSGGKMERQNPAFRSRTVFTSRTVAPSTTTPPYVPSPREYN